VKGLAGFLFVRVVMTGGRVVSTAPTLLPLALMNEVNDAEGSGVLVWCSSSGRFEVPLVSAGGVAGVAGVAGGAGVESSSSESDNVVRSIEDCICV
jgi:hypothetical protein